MIRSAIIFTVFLICFSSNCFASEESQFESYFSLGSGDVLQVSVWKDEELSREVVVRPDGKISYPLVGELYAAGRSISEIQKDLEKKIQEYVPDTPVTVMLKELKSSMCYVLGQVEEPGGYMMQGKIRVMQAIAMAGGLTRFADKNSIYILRNNGKIQKSIRFDYSKVSQGENLKSNIYLISGDTVVVP